VSVCVCECVCGVSSCTCVCVRAYVKLANQRIKQGRAVWVVATPLALP
jgi:hypothetical protein